MLTVGSLFSGIGGFDLGLERAGMRVVWQAESDEFCRRVLAKHWPDVPCYPDVRDLRADAIRALVPGVRRLQAVGVEAVDVLCGGFPCQDISLAGKGAGIDGERSGLWGEYARLVGELRPRYVIVENVAALLGRGLERVLGDLAALGYDAEWDCLPASAFGAPHRRDRLWLVAYPSGDDGRSRRPGRSAPSGAREPESERTFQVAGHGVGADWWAVEPDVGRVAHGVPARVDRLRSLGNSLVPQIAEWIGARIVSHELSEHPAWGQQ